MRVILASASPRRRELLTQIGIEFEVQVSDVEERITATEPCEVVQELSRQKAEAVMTVRRKQLQPGMEEAQDSQGRQDLQGRLDSQTDRILVIGADTIVACGREILGKPKDAADAVRMLRLLSGRSHEVYTGVTLVCDWNPEPYSFYECTKVHFAPMTEAEIAEYVATGDPMDKAGAYGIQGFCARYITGIEGDYNNVVGLPVGRVYQEMKKLL